MVPERMKNDPNGHENRNETGITCNQVKPKELLPEMTSNTFATAIVEFPVLSCAKWQKHFN